MANPDDEYVIIDSPLSSPLRRNSVEIDVQIYRGVDEEGWVLDVVDNEGASTFWDDKLSTDQAAMDSCCGPYVLSLEMPLGLSQHGKLAGFELGVAQKVQF